MEKAEVIKRIKRIRNEQFCECIGNCSCNFKEDKEALDLTITLLSPPPNKEVREAIEIPEKIKNWSGKTEFTVNAIIDCLSKISQQLKAQSYIGSVGISSKLGPTNGKK